jgi:hypothetical protein
LWNLQFVKNIVLCSDWQSVTEVPGRHLVHNGDLAELDAESFTQIQKVYALLPSESDDSYVATK